MAVNIAAIISAKLMLIIKEEDEDDRMQEKMIKGSNVNKMIQ